MFCYSALTIALRYSAGFGSFLASYMCLSMTHASLMTLMLVLVADHFGSNQIAFVWGVSGLLSTPLLLATPSITGFFRDTLGSYDHLMLFAGGLTACAGLSAFWLWMSGRKKAQNFLVRPSYYRHKIELSIAVTGGKSGPCKGNICRVVHFRVTAILSDSNNSDMFQEIRLKPEFSRNRPFPRSDMQNCFLAFRRSFQYLLEANPTQTTSQQSECWNDSTTRNLRLANATLILLCLPSGSCIVETTFSDLRYMRYIRPTSCGNRSQ